MLTSSDKAARKKIMGAHYTPPWLADFVADRILQHLDVQNGYPVRILDPACGDGVLLEAMLKRLADAGIPCSDACGVDADEDALLAANERLLGPEPVEGQGLYPGITHLMAGDFLALSTNGKGQLSLWDSISPQDAFSRPFDIVIANPPYVRTQVLGSEKSQGLAKKFGLNGRVDLYHAFLVAATRVLRPGGVIGVITSNRFLTTNGAATIREYLATHYKICEVIDLGDTKVFEAAVLPAVFIGKRCEANRRSANNCAARFLRVYMDSDRNSSQHAVPSPGLGDVLSVGKPGTYQVPEGTLNVTAGRLLFGKNPRQVWSLVSDEEEEWLRQVRAGSAGVFGDVARVRVGIKTTADSVFIRSDWLELPDALQPEEELLRPLLRHENARRWRQEGDRIDFRVLYPHKVYEGRRRAVDLNHYPKARAYLESNRPQLEMRQYISEAGRNWYEIWVPQDPDAWIVPKIVFPDISPEPRFYIDFDGNLVDGDCYWISLRSGVHEDFLYLLLSIANSRLMTKFHDLAFNNRLYSGRRRYITQYVAKYPFPPLDHPASQKLVRLVKKLVSEMPPGPDPFEVSAIEAKIEMLVEKAFGLATTEEK